MTPVSPEDNPLEDLGNIAAATVTPMKSHAVMSIKELVKFAQHGLPESSTNDYYSSHDDLDVSSSLLDKKSACSNSGDCIITRECYDNNPASNNRKEMVGSGD